MSCCFFFCFRLKEHISEPSNSPILIFPEGQAPNHVMCVAYTKNYYVLWPELEIKGRCLGVCCRAYPLI